MFLICSKCGVMRMVDEAARSWDQEYTAGRYIEEPPVTFVGDILTAAQRGGLSSGLYIGCGNGRNYLPLVRGGLDLIGLDISKKALEQLAARAPELRDHLVLGDVAHLPPEDRYDLVIGIQVFQHGTRAIAHDHIRRAQERVRPGGAMAVRVNAVGTEIFLRHEVVEQGESGGLTIRYLEGPKAGLEIHFFARDELADLFSRDFESLMPLQRAVTYRQPPAVGQWSQWEGIWRRLTATEDVRKGLLT